MGFRNTYEGGVGHHRPGYRPEMAAIAATDRASKIGPKEPDERAGT